MKRLESFDSFTQKQKVYYLKSEMCREIYDMTDNINKASFEMSRLNRYYIFYKPVTNLQKAGKSKGKSKKKIKKINLSE